MHEAKLGELHKLIEEANRVLKTVKHRHSEKSVIAANEQLRFACCHLSRAVTYSHSLFYSARKSADFCEEIDDATVHCQKAMNYAFEYGIGECVAYTQEFAPNDFGEFNISDVLKDYPDILGRAAAASSFVELKDLSRPTNEYRGAYDTVYQDWNKVYKLREEFRNKSKEIKFRNRLAIGTLIVAFLAAAGAAINGVSSFYKAFYGSDSQSTSTQVVTPSPAPLTTTPPQPPTATLPQTNTQAAPKAP